MLGRARISQGLCLLILGGSGPIAEQIFAEWSAKDRTQRGAQRAGAPR